MLFGGGGSREAVPEQPQNQSFEQRTAGGACEVHAKCELCRVKTDNRGSIDRFVCLFTAFTQCLDATSNDLTTCNYYLEQLKVC
jgi:hypothetical protein